jgi:RNA polymerase sigma factor (sigma-70 family)
MPEYTEQELIKGCRDQNRNMQEQLYKKYYSMFLKVCARYAKDMEDAEQLLNDGFLKIFLNVKNFSENGSFEGWMRKIMVNSCLDYLKSKWLKTSMQMNFNADKIAENTPSHHTDGLAKIEFKELVNMIQALPPMTRTVFNLYVFEGYAHKEIATMMDISEGTSHWHVNNGRTLLQKKIIRTKTKTVLYEKRV